jgi:hypothetical protein
MAVPDQRPVAAPGDLFRIDWNRHNRTQQQAMFDACDRPTLSQSPVYAAALADAGYAGTEYGLLRFQGRPVGAVLVEKRPFMRWGSSYRIYRGPLWLKHDMPDVVKGEFFRLIRQRFRIRTGRPVTFHPELDDTKRNRDLVAASGFRRIANGYRTIWLDLAQPRETLHARLAGKWRNQLRQGERNGLRLDVDTQGSCLDWLIERHEAHMAANNYHGPSRRLLETLTAQGKPYDMVRILRALHEGEPVGAILLTRHGRSTTYFVGWNGLAGRRLRAHHFLLWQAICLLQDEDVRWFDLGGVNDADAANVAHFKAGLRGTPTTLAGGYT